MNTPNGIKILRESRGWSLAELSKRLGGEPSRQMLNKYELGNVLPPASLLNRLAEVFKVSAMEVMTGPQTTITIRAFRKRTSLRASQRKVVEDEFIEKAQHFFNVQQKLNPTSEPVPVGQYSGLAPEAAADSCRKAWHLGRAPVRNLTQTLETNGIHVIPLDGAVDKFDGLCAEAQDSKGKLRHCAIAVGQGAFGGRYRFTLAHELGHLLLSSEDEAEANAFAGAFLAPGEIVRNRLGEKRNRIRGIELDALHSELGISRDAVVHRAFDLGIISRETYDFWCRKLRVMNSKQTSDDIPVESSTWLQTNIMRAYDLGLISEAEARDALTPEVFEKNLEADAPASPWSLRSMSAEEKRKALEESVETAMEIYNGSNTEMLVAEAGEVFDDGGL